MECGKVRDRFSSLLERELNPSEEEIVRAHIASCLECQKDFEQFEKTVRWLHSVGEVQVPDGFLSGIYEKMEERKRKGRMGEKARWGWSKSPFNLPIQAVAMVAIVFLVIYLTKMVPVEAPRLKDSEQAKAARSVENRAEPGLIQKGIGKEDRPPKPPLETPRLKDVGEKQAPHQVSVPQPAAPLKDQVARERKAEEVTALKTIEPLGAKPTKEITLTISDREKILPQLYELVKQSGGEIVTAERDILLASLPAASFSEFEKELAGLGSSAKAGKALSASGAKKKEGEEKESARLEADSESRIMVRIVLLQE